MQVCQVLALCAVLCTGHLSERPCDHADLPRVVLHECRDAFDLRPRGDTLGALIIDVFSLSFSLSFLGGGGGGGGRGIVV